MVLRIKTSLFIFLCIVVSSCTNPVKERADLNVKVFSKSDAKALFTMKCASCHGMDGKLGAGGAKDLSISILEENQIISIINNGQNSMPSFEASISKEQHIELVKFVKSLRK